MPARRAASIASSSASTPQRQTGMSPLARTHFHTKLDCCGSASIMATPETRQARNHGEIGCRGRFPAAALADAGDDGKRGACPARHHADRRRGLRLNC